MVMLLHSGRPPAACVTIPASCSAQRPGTQVPIEQVQTWCQVLGGQPRIPAFGLQQTAAERMAQAREVEETVEGMLLRLEEFCSLAGAIRSDTSQILEENIPLLKAKVTEMRGIYAKVDQLEAFVKMVGHHVSFLEDHVLRAERDHGAFSQALRRWRWLGSRGLPSFRNKLSVLSPPTFELPALYRTEDYFPVDAGEAAPQTPSCRHRL
ncbi:PREDICTED: breast carcinoma-amplified sequence 4 [Miniopterus natalensis]|uniref:breast carcinoma-amplified sequence 4 n=1 Tax=Miniopterus natalensis TaxID=291302 RepID=UPI0007A708D9|nr:PREDICTED: breast carcinoma-amplified sequence 4 [Miniopterus natalensis]